MKFLQRAFNLRAKFADLVTAMRMVVGGNIR